MHPTHDFLAPRHSFYGQVNPENLVYNANLQEFSHQVNYISCLATAGKLSVVEAHEKIHKLWQDLERSKRQLGVGKSPFDSSELN